MPPKPDLTPIVIKREHLSPRLKEMIGHPFTKSSLVNFGRLYGLGGAAIRLSRLSMGMSLPDYYAAMHAESEGPLSVKSARLSRIMSDVWSGYESLYIFLVNRSIHQQLYFSGLALGRVEAARIVQFLHTEMAREMRSSKMTVDPRFDNLYSTEARNIKLLVKTHPVFRVNMNGDLVFLPVTRREYMQYRFQQSRVGKLGVQPWLWRGFLIPPKAPASLKKLATGKIKQWSKEFGEQWRPSPVPRPVMVRVNSNASKRENTIRRVARKR